MSQTGIFLRFLPFGLLLTGCATTTLSPEVDLGSALDEAHNQQVAALQLQQERSERLREVSYNIRRANADLCPKTTKQAGFGYVSLDHFGRKNREAARSGLGIDDRLTVFSVASDSAASTAGLKKGDFLTAVNGEDLGFGKKAARRLLRSTGNGDPYSLTVYRGGEYSDVQIVPEQTCDYRVELTTSDSVNAYANGNAVFVTTGMMRFMRATTPARRARTCRKQALS